ncbi:endochitinase A2-like [Morus notabilis]|uniref:endochitinase A2-like n=1 Tax=Morus notabilis TaxID=981085 RepID=UPI000CED1E13|nr:endochitinase A2-like [Morus notabilis]
MPEQFVVFFPLLRYPTSSFCTEALSTGAVSMTTIIDKQVKQLGFDLINNPNLLATNPIISFNTAIWFWMTPQENKPSSHNVIIGRWTPSDADRSAGRVPGYGVITNIINGGLECGKGQDARVADRIGFYKRYCDILRVSYLGTTWIVIVKVLSPK